MLMDGIAEPSPNLTEISRTTGRAAYRTLSGEKSPSACFLLNYINRLAGSWYFLLGVSSELLPNCTEPHRTVGPLVSQRLINIRTRISASRRRLAFDMGGIAAPSAA